MSAAAAPVTTTAITPTVLVETSRALPLVSLAVSLRTGAIEDPDGKEGLTRFTGRLMRRTGGGKTPQEIDIAVDALGGSLGVDTSHSTAGFQSTFIARSLDPMVELVREVIAEPSFAVDELERLKRESEAELIEARDNDRALARYFFGKKLYEGHPYGRTTVGRIPTIEAFGDTDVRRHWARLFVQENLVFTFSGDIDRPQAEAVAQRIASGLSRGAAISDKLSDPVMAKGRRLVIVDKPERTQTQILIGGSGSHPHDQDHIALHVANTVFGGTFTARMTREIRSKRGWSYGAYSSMPYDRHRRGFSMWTFPKASDAAPCIRVELDMLKNLIDNGITKRELAWAKRYLVRSHAFALDTASKRVALELDALIYDLPAGYYESYTDRVQAVTLEEANAALRHRLSAEDLLVTVVGTESDIGGPVREAIDGLENVEVVPFDQD